MTKYEEGNSRYSLGKGSKYLESEMFEHKRRDVVIEKHVVGHSVKK